MYCAKSFDKRHPLLPLNRLLKSFVHDRCLVPVAAKPCGLLQQIVVDTDGNLEREPPADDKHSIRIFLATASNLVLQDKQP